MNGFFYSVRLVKPDKWNILTIFVAGVYHRFATFVWVVGLDQNMNHDLLTCLLQL